MDSNELKDIQDLFNSKEKWDAFIELYYEAKDVLIDNWIKDVFNGVKHLYEIDSTHSQGWTFLANDKERWMKLFPTETGENGVSICFELNGWTFSLYVNKKYCNADNVRGAIDSNVIERWFNDFNGDKTNYWVLSKTVPQSIIGVADSAKSLEKELYYWHVNKDGIAKQIWHLFQSFLNDEFRSLLIRLYNVSKIR